MTEDTSSIDPFTYLDHSKWKKTLPSTRLSALSALSTALLHLEEDDDIVSRSWRIIHRSILDDDTLFRHCGLRTVIKSVVSWRDPYFHHNPSAIDRLIHVLTTVAQNDPSSRTRRAAIDAIGSAVVELSHHLSDDHPKDSTEIITHVSEWIVGRLINCLNMEREGNSTAEMTMERVHYIYTVGLLYEHCGTYLNNTNIRMYDTVLYLLHTILSKKNMMKINTEESRNHKKQNDNTHNNTDDRSTNDNDGDDEEYEARAIFYILNHCLEDDLIIGQLFLSLAKLKSKTLKSNFARPEILSFLGIWIHRSRNEIEMSRDIIKMVELRTLLKGGR